MIPSSGIGDGDPAPSGAPLTGLRIVEVSGFVATPLCGMTLAHLGAEVIRVEPLTGGPDRGRWPLSPQGRSLYWTGLNRGKKSVAVDLRDPRGRELVADLVVAGGDSGGILVTNTDRLDGLRHDDLVRRRPDVVHVLLTGRHGGGSAVDYTVQAGTGFPAVTGTRDSAGPVNHVLPAWDVAAGLYLATGLLAAERRRLRTGEGSSISVALEDVALATAGTLGYLAEAQLRPDVRREPDGNDVYGTFGRDVRTADDVRYMLVALTPRHWADLLRVTGLEDAVTALGHALGTDFGDEGDRFRHRDVLGALVDEWFSARDAADVEASLSGTSLLWERYRTFADLAADDARLLREHPLFTEAGQDGVGAHLAPRSAIAVDGTQSPPRPAPSLGQHGPQVLAEALGLPEQQVRALCEEGLLAPGSDA